MTIQCCVCNKVKKDGEWIRQENHIKDASHTYCPICLEQCLHSVEEELSLRKKYAVSLV